jgi:hypothetical protein
MVTTRVASRSFLGASRAVQIGSFVVSLLALSSAASAAPAGDNCTNPILITALPFHDAGRTTCGLANDFNNAGPSVCRTDLPSAYPGPDMVYAFYAGTGNNVGFSLDLTGSTGDLALFLTKGSCPGDASCVASSLDFIGAGAGPESIPAGALTPGSYYYLWIDSYAASGAGSCGGFTLDVTGSLGAPPSVPASRPWTSGLLAALLLAVSIASVRARRLLV